MKFHFLLFPIFFYSSISTAALSNEQIKNYKADLRAMGVGRLAYEALVRTGDLAAKCGPEKVQALIEHFKDNPTQAISMTSEECSDSLKLYSLSSDEANRRLDTAILGREREETFKSAIHVKPPQLTTVDKIVKKGNEDCLYVAEQTFNHWKLRRNWAPVGHQVNSEYFANEQIKITKSGRTTTQIWDYSQYDFVSQTLTLRTAIQNAISNGTGITYSYTWSLILNPNLPNGTLTLDAIYSNADSGKRSSNCSISAIVNASMSPIE